MKKNMVIFLATFFLMVITLASYVVAGDGPDIKFNQTFLYYYNDYGTITIKGLSSVYTDSAIIPDEIDNTAVTAIDDYAFSQTWLTRINIPDGISEIGENVFSGCSFLTNIEVSPSNSNFASIDGVLFNKKDKKLLAYPIGKTEGTYSIPDGIVSIGPEAFYTSNLMSIKIPDSVERIEECAFTNCDGLFKITIPANVTDIKDNAFVACDNLSNIKVSADNKRYCVYDGILYDKEYNILICLPLGKKIDANKEFYHDGFDFEEGTEGIAGYAFAGCMISKIDLPNTIHFIGDGAFAVCRGLNSIRIPNKVTTISAETFSNCENLAKVTLPDNIREIGDRAFNECVSLSEINIPQNLEYIGEKAFQGCSRLTNLELPETVMFIGEDAFSGCGQLILTVVNGSYAMQYAQEHNLSYEYADNTDWLNAPMENEYDNDVNNTADFSEPSYSDDSTTADSFEMLPDFSIYSYSDVLIYNANDIIDRIQNAAYSGDAVSMACLGDIYYYGLVDEYYDEVQAFEWYQSAADLGDAYAMYRTGLMYECGTGVAQDYEKAEEWYLKSADKGNADAMLAIGLLYYDDVSKQIEWYKKAASAGSVGAMYNLGDVYYYGMDIDQDFEEAFKWYNQAADAGDEWAMAVISEMYRNGEGVQQDEEKADEWYNKAIENGFIGY